MRLNEIENISAAYRIKIDVASRNFFSYIKIYNYVYYVMYIYILCHELMFIYSVLWVQMFQNYCSLHYSSISGNRFLRKKCLHVESKFFKSLSHDKNETMMTYRAVLWPHTLLRLLLAN